MLAELHFSAPRALNSAEAQLQGHDLPELASAVHRLQGSVEVGSPTAFVQAWDIKLYALLIWSKEHVTALLAPTFVPMVPTLLLCWRYCYLRSPHGN